VLEVSSVCHGFVTIRRDGETYLGIETGIPGKSIAVRKLASGPNARGWIVRGDEITPWDTGGVIEHEGTLYVYGPYVEFTPLRDIVSLDTEDALLHLERLSAALSVLEERDQAPHRLHGRGILFLTDGSVLFLPPNAVQAITEQLQAEDRFEELEYFNHPDLDNRHGATYAIAALAYRVVTGTWPITTRDEHELHERLRDCSFLPPELIRPELRPEVCDQIKRTLFEEERVSPADWRSAIREWRDSGITRDLDYEEEAENRKRVGEARRRLERRYHRQELVRKYWKQGVVVAIIVALVGSIPGTIIYNHLQPRQTAGMGPRELVEAFYSSVNTLNHELMSDAVTDGAGDALVREVRNVFVTSRVRQAYQVGDEHITAQEWVDRGRPSATQDMWVYGIAELQVELLSEDEDEHIYQVSYEHWAPGDASDLDPEELEQADEPPPLTGRQLVDRVRVRRVEDGWIIDLIESQSAEPLRSRYRQESSGYLSDPAGASPAT